MERGLIRTLLNILFLSSLECVLGSVVRQGSYRNSYPSSWTGSVASCSHRAPGEWALPTLKKEVDGLNIFDPTSSLKWIGQKATRTYNLYSTNSSSWYPNTVTECGYTTTTSQRTLRFGHCGHSNYFYCYDEDSPSPVTFIPFATTWQGAKDYCRRNHKHIVTLKGDVLLEDLPKEDLFYIWTGIHRTEPGGGWKSSAGKPTDYEDWAEGQPAADGDCVAISNKDKKMANLDCGTLWPSYCFNDNLVLVQEDKTWEEALEHCRAVDLTDPSLLTSNHHRSDLISISGPSDQLTVWSKIDGATTNEVWTGLRYLAHKWFWVDGTNVPYQDLPTCPVPGKYCGTVDRDNSAIAWNIRDCNERRNFLCYRKY